MKKGLLIGLVVAWAGFNAWYFLFSGDSSQAPSIAEDAETVLAEALAQAAAEDKAVLVHIGAPWCGWCRKLEEFLEAEKSILDQDFVTTKVDTDTMANGQIVAGRLRGTSGGGIPWMAILNSQGETIITSDSPEGNIGYPGDPAGIDYFISMLQKTAKRITPEQFAGIKSVLEERSPLR